MTSWNNYHVYYSNINELILLCIEPFFNDKTYQRAQYFWERHYAGGSHLRVRLTADPKYIGQVDKAMVHHVETFLKTQPSAPVHNYSANKCRQMLVLDGEEFSPDYYNYRVNEICPVPYQRSIDSLPSEATVAIVEDFLQDVRPLAVWTISRPDRVRESILCLYFWTALFLCNDLPQGSVSYKSHWSGFAASCRNRTLIDRIRISYGDHKPQLEEIMCQALACHRQTSATLPHLLVQWQSLLERYSLRTSAEIKKGSELTPRMKTVADVHKGHQWAERNVVEESDFLNILYKDDFNLLLLGQDPAMTESRVLMNVLYLYVQLVGLNFLDKMCLCYYAYRTVEDYFHCNLTDIANNTFARLRAENKIAIS